MLPTLKSGNRGSYMGSYAANKLETMLRRNGIGICEANYLNMSVNQDAVRKVIEAGFQVESTDAHQSEGLVIKNIE